MPKQQLNIGPAATLNIENCQGRLSLQGSSKGTFSYSSADEVSVLQEGSLVNVLAANDLKAYVPHDAAVTIQYVEHRLTAKELRSLRIDHADYDVKVSDLRESLIFGTIDSDLEVKKTAGIVGQTINGDVSAKEIKGDIRISTIRDDFNLRGCSGKIEVSRIQGDAFISQITGVVKVDSVAGDAILQGPLPAEKHHIISAGDVIVYWPRNRNVQFLVTHKGDLINDMRLPNETKIPGEFQATIGDDSCRLIIEAQGNVYLRPERTEKSKGKSKSRSKSRKKDDDDDFDFDLEDLLDPEELLEKIGDGLKSMVMLQKRKKGKGLLNKIFGKVSRSVDEWAAEADDQLPPEKQPGKAQAVGKPTAFDAEEERRIVLKLLDAGSITVDEAAERLKNLG